MSVYHFGKCRPEKFHLGAEVTVAQLAHALTGTGLTISNHPNGGIVIHRFAVRRGVQRTTIPFDQQPTPPGAA